MKVWGKLSVFSIFSVLKVTLSATLGFMNKGLMSMVCYQ